MNVSFHTQPEHNILQGRPVKLVAQLTGEHGDQGLYKDSQLKQYKFKWSVTPNGQGIQSDSDHPWMAQWTPSEPGDHCLRLDVTGPDPTHPSQPSASWTSSLEVRVHPRPSSAKEPVTVTLAPALSGRTNDDGLFQSIRQSTGDLDFSHYKRFVDRVMSRDFGKIKEGDHERFKEVNHHRASVFPGVDAYQRLKVATEVYLMLSVRVLDQYDFEHQYDPETHKAKHFQDLPVNARNYLQKIAALTGAALRIVSVGPHRDQTIVL